MPATEHSNRKCPVTILRGCLWKVGSLFSGVSETLRIRNPAFPVSLNESRIDPSPHRLLESIPSAGTINLSATGNKNRCDCGGTCKAQRRGFAHWVKRLCGVIRAHGIGRGVTLLPHLENERLARRRIILATINKPGQMQHTADVCQVRIVPNKDEQLVAWPGQSAGHRCLFCRLGL